MPRFEEGVLAFEFGERWKIFKLDEHSDYRERIGKIEGTKTAPFEPDAILYLYRNQ